MTRGEGSSATAERANGRPIGAVSSLLGIPVPTIRSWERRHGVPTPPRTEGKHRRYGDAEVEQLRRLRDLITRGYAVGDAVSRLGRPEPPSQAGELHQGAVDAAMALDPEALRRALTLAADRLGVEDAIRHVVFPTMREIGSRWKSGTCEVEHEHLATTAVRSWLSRQVAMAPPPSRTRPVVLACGPKDLHTIGLEGFGVILTRRGWPCRVLGAMTPTGSLVATVRQLRASAVVIAAQRSVSRKAAVASLEAVQGTGALPSFAGDAFAAPSRRRGVPGTYLGEDPVEAAGILESALRPARRRAAQRRTATIGGG